jgi:hydrogenase-4 component F
MLLLGLLLTPIMGALLLLFCNLRIAGYVNVAISSITLFFASILGLSVLKQGSISLGNQWFYLDKFNIFLIVLTTFIGVTTAIFSKTYLHNELTLNKLRPQSIRLFYSLYQLFMCTMLLVLTTNNLGVLWIAMEGATLTTVLLVSLYRTPASLEAAWKYLVLCGIGIAQALLGTILLYFSAEKIIGLHDGLLWTQLQAISHQLSPTVAGLAFIFIIVGYGTKAGFVPLHNWLPDAHGEGPAPVSAILSGLLLNVAVYAIIRFQAIVAGAIGAPFTHHLLLGFGLLNVLVSAFFLLRQKEIKRLYAYSSIEHMGLITFAFGLGTPIALFAALLHMVVHSLSKTAAFFGAGQVIQFRHTPRIDQITGLIQDKPWLGWALLFSTLALLGMPPFGIFVSEFLILLTTIHHQPWLAPLLFLGLLIAFAALFHKVQNMVLTPSTPTHSAEITLRFSNLPIYCHLVLVLGLGFCIPIYLWGWFTAITRLLGGGG